jgi:hypothetical protein
MKRIVLAAVLFSATTMAAAQSVECDTGELPGFVTSDDGSSAFYGILPLTPNSSSPIAIEASKTAFLPESVATSIVGASIHVTLTGRYSMVGIPPPLACLPTTIGPLIPGTYTLTAEFVDTDFGGTTSGPTIPFDVAGGAVDSAAPLPANAAVSLATLAILSGLLGLFVLRRRCIGGQ